MFEWSDRLVSGRAPVAEQAQRGAARTGRPGNASGTIALWLTTKLPLTRTWRMPADGRVLPGRWPVGDRCRVEYDDVGVAAGLQPPLGPHRRHVLLQELGREQAAPAQRLGEPERPPHHG